MYIGEVKIKELSDLLSKEISDNKIIYENYEIEFFSETGQLHVKDMNTNKEKRFNEPNQVVEFLSRNRSKVKNESYLKNFRDFI